MSNPFLSSKATPILALIAVFGIGLVAGTYLRPAILNRTDDRMQAVDEAFNLIQRRYVEDVDAGNLASAAVEGMIGVLDPHTSYVPPEQAVARRQDYEGEFGGIGVWFEMLNDTARVVSVVAGGPGDNSGLRSGDHIVGIDGERVVGADANDVQNSIRGPKSKPVTLTIDRRSREAEFDVKIIRDTVPLVTVEASHLLDDSTGFIRIGRFSERTDDEFRESLDALRSRGMKRLILDLRDNPGGVMESAVEVVDELVSGNDTIVYTRSRSTSRAEVERAGRRGEFETEPVIVLVNEFSASASEIVAGALQDHDRAVIVGRRTFGKALVQQPYRLSDGSILQLTVARYYTPSGRLIQTPYSGSDIHAYLAAKPPSIPNGNIDSTKFSSRAGRPLDGSGGIVPDVIVTEGLIGESTDPVIRTILEQAVDIGFARDWMERQDQLQLEYWGADEDRFIGEFRDRVDLKRALASFVQSARSQEFEITAESVNRADRRVLETILAARIGQRLYGSGTWFRFLADLDPMLLAARKSWGQAQELLESTRKD